MDWGWLQQCSAQDAVICMAFLYFAIVNIGGICMLRVFASHACSCSIMGLVLCEGVTKLSVGKGQSVCLHEVYIDVSEVVHLSLNAKLHTVL